MANEPMERSWVNVSGYGPAVMALLIVFNERAAGQPINEPDGPAANM